MIVNQVIPGQEEGNAELIETLDVGAVARDKKEVRELVEEAFAHRGRQWLRWRENLDKVRQPGAAMRIAELILNETGDAPAGPGPLRLFEGGRADRQASTAAAAHGPARTLLCDFHIHTNYSDGRLTLPDVIDFYGRRNFDCICVTDHVTDPRRLIGKYSELLNFTLAPGQLDEYFDMLERERRRAWRKYEMLVMTGLEFNKEGFRRKTSGHLLGIDLKAPIPPSLDFVETIAQIHSQGGLAVAAPPHLMKSEWGKNTLFLWENQDLFAPIMDAWEIANRNNIFTPVGLKRLPYLANSDFHKPKHIFSWKTLLQCEKEPEAIKDCIRKNDKVSLTLYRGDANTEALRAQPLLVETPMAATLAPKLEAARLAG
jgi:hypothetical protein